MRPSQPATSSIVGDALTKPAIAAGRPTWTHPEASSTTLRATALSSAFTQADKWTRLSSGESQEKDLQRSKDQVEYRVFYIFTTAQRHLISWQLRSIRPVWVMGKKFHGFFLPEAKLLLRIRCFSFQASHDSLRKMLEIYIWSISHRI